MPIQASCWWLWKMAASGNYVKISEFQLHTSSLSQLGQQSIKRYIPSRTRILLFFYIRVTGNWVHMAFSTLTFTSTPARVLHYVFCGAPHSYSPQTILGTRAWKPCRRPQRNTWCYWRSKSPADFFRKQHFILKFFLQKRNRQMMWS